MGRSREVYRVKHRFLGRQAMKVFKMVGMTAAQTETLLDEAALLSRLGHPNIVRVFDADTIETSLGICGFFTMEYVAGGTLEHYWRSHGNKLFRVATCVEIVRQVCRGLVVAHSEHPPIIHRDIKPQNVLVGYDAGGLRVKLSDFGLAKRVNPLTMMASMKGTLSFKPPEVFQDSSQDSPAGDVWAMGCVLYLLLTDRLPFTSLDEGEAHSESRFQRPLIPPSRINLLVDPGLDQIVFRALSLAPKDRYPTGAELLEDLMRWESRSKVTPGSSKQAVQAEESKTALGEYASVDEERARQMAGQALTTAKRGGSLAEASDLMEEAMSMLPGLREEYEGLLYLWRKGIAM